MQLRYFSKKSLSRSGLIISALVICSLSFQTVFAETLNDLNKKRDYYSSLAELAKKQREQKEKDAKAVKNQITSVEADISDTEKALKQTDDQINQTQAAIDGLIDKIKTAETNLADEKDKLGKVVASRYMDGDSGLLEAVFGSEDLSQFIERDEYYRSINQQILMTMERIETEKNKLNADKVEQDRQMIVALGLKNNQTAQRENLASKKTIKQRLLSDTANMIVELKGDEQDAQAKVRELQAKIEAIIAAGRNRSGQITSSNDSSWYYSQLDGRWSNEKLGKYATIGQYGCLITSLAMAATKYGNAVDPLDAVKSSSFARGGKYDGALISTPIIKDGGSQPINWAVVDDELANGNPVIVGIALGVDMGNSYGVSHFVVLKPNSKNGDKYSMHDPLGPDRGYNLSQVKAMRIVRP